MDYNIILPLMIAVVASSAVSRVISSETIYTFKLVRRGIDIRQLEQTSPLRTVTVGEAMTRNFPNVSPTLSVKDLVDRLRRTGHHGFPVVNEDGTLYGVVTLSDVEAAMSGGNPEAMTVADIATSSVSVVYPDEYLHDVFVKLGSREVGRIPVVDRADPKRLLGVLRRHDIIRAYNRAVTRRPAR
jgi:CIC family chloride channel protein